MDRKRIEDVVMDAARAAAPGAGDDARRGLRVRYSDLVEILVLLLVPAAKAGETERARLAPAQAGGEAADFTDEQKKAAVAMGICHDCGAQPGQQCHEWPTPRAEPHPSRVALYVERLRLGLVGAAKAKEAPAPAPVPGDAAPVALGLAAQADAAFGRELRVCPTEPAPTIHVTHDDEGNADAMRSELAAIVERVAAEGLPGPRDLDGALDAILAATGRDSCPLSEYECGDARCPVHHPECNPEGQCWHDSRSTKDGSGPTRAPDPIVAAVAADLGTTPAEVERYAVESVRASLDFRERAIQLVNDVALVMRGKAADMVDIAERALREASGCLICGRYSLCPDPSACLGACLGGVYRRIEELEDRARPRPTNASPAVDGAGGAK